KTSDRIGGNTVVPIVKAGTGKVRVRARRVGGDRGPRRKNFVGERPAVRLNEADGSAGRDVGVSARRPCRDLDAIVSECEEGFVSFDGPVNFAAELVANVLRFGKTFAI